MIPRTMCDVLEDMRKCNEHRNYTNLSYLIEEAQSMANAMETSLGNKKSYHKLCKTLRKKLNELRVKLGEEEEEDHYEFY